MSGMYMSEWPMFGTKDPNLGSSTDLLFDRDFIFGAFATCLIQGGYPVGATFERTGDVVTTGGTFGPNEVATLDGKMIHFGKVTETSPSYDISPLVRPTAPDIYDTCASAPNPDKHGLNWEFSDPKNAWAWDLLDGRADGVNAVVNGGFDVDANWSKGAGWSISGGTANRVLSAAEPIFQGGFSSYQSSRVEICYSVSSVSSGVIASFLFSPSSPLAGTNITTVSDSCDRFSIPSDFNGNLQFVPSADFVGSLDNVTWKSVSPATGTLNLKGLSVAPSVTEWQTVGDFNILSGATGNQIIYIESGTGLICATDGTNTTKSVQPYVAGQDHTVSLAFGDSKMQIYVDGVNGTQVPFVGTFTPGETLKWGLNNEDIFSIGNVCGQTTSSFSESVHLAEELAYDL